MDNYDVIQENIMLKVNIILKKFGIHPKDFLCQYNKKNIAAHRTILESLPPMIEDDTVRENIIKSNRQKQLSLIDNKNQGEYKNSPDYNICSILKTYLYDFYNCFYFFSDGTPVFTNAENLSLPSMDDKPNSSINYSYIKQKLKQFPRDFGDEFEGIVLPNGNSYFAPLDHEHLAYWLNVNSIEIEKAIRFEAIKDIEGFYFSSLFNDKFAQKDSEKELIAITHRQGEFLGVVYDALLYGWKYMAPLEKQLKYSDGFGIGKNEIFDIEGISGRNMRILDIYLGEHFDKSEYVREAMLNNNPHSPLK